MLIDGRDCRDLPSGTHISRRRVLGQLRKSMAGVTDGTTDPKREPSSCGRLGGIESAIEVLADTRRHVFLYQDFVAVIGAVVELAFWFPSQLWRAPRYFVDRLEAELYVFM